MGDRCNIVVRASQDNRGDVWFYGHWSGGDYKQAVARALAKGWRHGDTAYLARIVFDEFTAGQYGEETGFGISTRLQDNEHPILVVDDDKQEVWVIPEAKLVDGRIPPDYKAPHPASYAAFVGQTLQTEKV